MVPHLVTMFDNTKIEQWFADVDADKEKEKVDEFRDHLAKAGDKLKPKLKAKAKKSKVSESTFNGWVSDAFQTAAIVYIDAEATETEEEEQNTLLMCSENETDFDLDDVNHLNYV